MMKRTVCEYRADPHFQGKTLRGSNVMIINTLKNQVVPAIFSRIPQRLLAALINVRPLVAYYHMVSDRQVPHVRHLYTYKTVKEFKQDLEVFLKSYRLIGLPELLEAIGGRTSLPADALLLTFDDGFREMYDVVAPILLDKGAPATFFITTSCLDNMEMAHHNRISLILDWMEEKGAVEDEEKINELLPPNGKSVREAILRLNHTQSAIVDQLSSRIDLDFRTYLSEQQPYLTSEQVHRLIEKGFSIGAHSINHPMYSLLSVDEQIYQTTCSVRMIREHFSLDYGAFSFPHGAGAVGARVLDEVLGSGYLDVSFGSAGMLRDANPRHFERFSMENTPDSAKKVLGRQYARTLLKRISGQGTVRRA